MVQLFSNEVITICARIYIVEAMTRFRKYKVLRRTEVINSLLDILSNAENIIYICGNFKFPSQLLSLEITKNTILATANKDMRVKQRYLFEITKDNIQVGKDAYK